jgi:integrase
MKHKRKIRRGGLSPDKYLSERQVETLLRYVAARAAKGGFRAAVNEFIVIMLLYSGLRAEELLALRIAQTPHTHSKDVIDVLDGKGSIQRAVEIPEWLSRRICEFVRLWRHGAKPGSILVPSEAGFRRVVVQKQSQTGKDQMIERNARMIYKSLYNKLGRIGRNAGIGRLHPHMLRHTYGTRTYNIQQDLRFVQDQLGHSDPRTTAIYAKTTNPLRRQQVQSYLEPNYPHIVPNL